METPAGTLFDAINSEDDIDRLIASQVEDLYLDFKTKRDHSAGLVDEDLQKVLSKAISGFANADGGLIVLGVDAPQGKTPEKKPIIPLAEFDQEVNSYIPRATSFGVEGVRTKRIPLRSGPGGFVLIHVPKSDRAPHCSMKDRRYYQRIGDSFLPMEHYQVADTFGRRHHPNLIPYARVRGDVNRRGGIELILGVRNIGRAIGKYPYLSIEEKANFETAPYGLSGNGHFGLPPLEGAQQYREYKGGADHVIHPEVALDVTKLRGSFPVNQDLLLQEGIQGVSLSGRIVADGFPLKSWRISIARDGIQDAVKHPASPGVLIDGVLSSV